MTVSILYVGELEGFQLVGGNWNGNIPERLTADFPPVRGGHGHGALRDWAEPRGIAVAQVDFDAFVARVTKAQLLDFVAHCYDRDPSYHDPAQMNMREGRAYLVEQLEDLRAAIAALDAGREYGLVSACT